MKTVISYHPSTARHFFVFSEYVNSDICLIHAFPRLPKLSSHGSRLRQIRIPLLYYLQVALTKFGFQALNELSYFILPPIFEALAACCVPLKTSLLVVQGPVTPLLLLRARLTGTPIVLSSATPCNEEENRITRHAVLKSRLSANPSQAQSTLDYGTQPIALMKGDSYYMKRVDGIICISSFAASTYRERSDRYICSYLPISLLQKSGFDGSDDATLDGKQELIVLMAGHWSVRKGFYIALKAFMHELKGKPVKLVHAGICNDREVQTIARRSDGQIQLIGHVSQDRLLQLMRTSHILLHPAFSEGAGYVIIEAMHAGMAVVSSPYSIGPDLIQDEKNGVILPRISTEAISIAIERLDGDRDLLRSIRHQSLVTAKQQLTPEYSAQSLSNALQALESACTVAS